MKPKAHTLALLASAVSVALVPASATAQLEEVVVTAQKRTESLQNVSIAITAFNSDQLQRLGVTNLQDLTDFVSGAELFDDRGAGQPTWVIRGVGLSDFNSNNTPTAAIYYDEYYLGSNVLGGIGLFDIDRVEVLKGPQGGLYGRNTSGGAVLIDSVRATVGEDVNGYVRGSYGRWERAGIEGAIGADLGDNAAFRIAAMTDQGGGWQDSLATSGDDDHGDRDFTAARAQLTFQPSDDVDVWLKLEGGQDKSETTLAYSRALYDPASGDYCASALAGRSDEQNCVTLSNLTNLFALSPGDPGVLPSRQDFDGSRVMTNPINELDNDWWGANLQLSWDLGSASFLSITGYLDYENNQVFDYDGSELRLFHEDGEAELRSWSQEFRLVSQTDGPLTWLAGVTYAEDEVDEFRRGDTTDNVLVLATVITRGFEQETESWSVYGQLDYELNDALKIHGSLRYTDETKDLRDASTYDVFGDFFYFQDVEKSYDLDENLSGHLGVDYTLSDDVMLYGRVTRGLKSGGFFGGFSLSESELEPYAEEDVFAYEIGLKSQWLESTLQVNATAYFYDYQDVQGFTQELSETTGTVVTKLGNLGDAEHKGAELDINWLPVEGLYLGLAVSWLDAEITDSDTLAVTLLGTEVPLEGLQRSFAPTWSTAFEGRYEWQLDGGLRAAVQVNYSWRDDLYGDDSAISDLDYAAYSHEDYELLGARLSLGGSDESWDVSLIGRNLTDEEYWTSATTDDLGSFVSMRGQPLSYAIEATYRW